LCSSQKYSLKTAKHSDFQKFAQIMKLIEKRKHLTQDGLKTIALIAGQMNVKKDRKILKSSETIRQIRQKL